MTDNLNQGPERQRSLEERMTECPIHQWADLVGVEVAPDRRILGVDPFLAFVEAQTGMPPSLQRPFHELLVTRGQFGAEITEDEAKQFAREAREMTLRYEMTPLEARWLKDMLFQPVQGQWVEHSLSQQIPPEVE